MSVTVTKTVRGKLPSLPFASIAESVLGKNYELSLVFCADRLSRTLNRTYRQKDYPTNVLSFPLTKSSGEIFINLRKLKGFTSAELFIHGLYHLKGLDHGRTMEEAEAKTRKRFNL